MENNPSLWDAAIKTAEQATQAKANQPTKPLSPQEKFERGINYLQDPHNPEYHDVKLYLEQNKISHRDFKRDYSIVLDRQSPKGSTGSALYFADKEPSQDLWSYDPGAWSDFANSFYNSAIINTAEGIGNFIPGLAAAFSSKAEFSHTGKTPDWAINWLNGVSSWAERNTAYISDKAQRDMQEGSFSSWRAFAASFGQSAGSLVPALAGGYVGAGLRVLTAGGRAAAVAGTAVRGAGGASRVMSPFITAKTASAIGSSAGAYFNILPVVVKGAKEAGLSTEDAWRFANVVAPIVAASEGIGLSYIADKIASPVSSVASKQFLKPSLQHIAKNGATPEAFRDATKIALRDVIASGKNLRLKGLETAVKGAHGFSTEFIQEGFQAYMEALAEDLYDDHFADEGATVGKGKFGTDVTSFETFKSSLEEALLGGLVGGGLASSTTIFSPITTESVYAKVAKAKLDGRPDQIDDLKNYVQYQVKKENITAEEAQTVTNFIDDVAGVQDRIWFEQKNPASRYQSFFGIKFKDQLETFRTELNTEQFKKDYPSLVEEYNANINNLIAHTQGAIQSIAENDNVQELSDEFGQQMVKFQSLLSRSKKDFDLTNAEKLFEIGGSAFIKNTTKEINEAKQQAASGKITKEESKQRIKSALKKTKEKMGSQMASMVAERVGETESFEDVVDSIDVIEYSLPDGKMQALPDVPKSFTIEAYNGAVQEIQQALENDGKNPNTLSGMDKLKYAQEKSEEVAKELNLTPIEKARVSRMLMDSFDANESIQEALKARKPVEEKKTERAAKKESKPTRAPLSERLKTKKTPAQLKNEIQRDEEELSKLRKIDTSQDPELKKDINKEIKAYEESIKENKVKLKELEEAKETEEAEEVEEVDVEDEEEEGGSIVTMKAYRTEGTEMGKFGAAFRGSGIYYALDKPFKTGRKGESVTEVEIEINEDNVLDLTASQLSGTPDVDSIVYGQIRKEAQKRFDATPEGDRNLNTLNDFVREVALEKGYTGVISFIEPGAPDNKTMQNIGREYVDYANYKPAKKAAENKATPPVESKKVKALEEQSTSTTQSKIDATKADIERIQKLPFVERIPELIKLGIIDSNISTQMGLRFPIIININGVKVPFYRSSAGTSGKIKGSWNPFFGFGKSQNGNEWLIKGNTSQFNSYYNSKAIENYSKLLDSVLNWDTSIDNVRGVSNHPFMNMLNQVSLEEFNKEVYGIEDLGIINGTDGTSNPLTYVDNKIKEINAKYDAELKALEQPTTQTTEQAPEAKVKQAPVAVAKKTKPKSDTKQTKLFEEETKKTPTKEEQKEAFDSNLDDLIFEKRTGRTPDTTPSFVTSAVYQKVKAELQRLFPGISVSEVENLVNKHGVEVLGMAMKNSVKINKNSANQETLVHEFAHVYADILEAVDKSLYEQAAELVDGTAVMKEVQEEYPDLSLEEQRKEAVITLMGRQGSRMLAAKVNNNLIQKIAEWLKKVWSTIKNHFGKANANDLARIMSYKAFMRQNPIVLKRGVDGRVYESRSPQEAKVFQSVFNTINSLKQSYLLRDKMPIEKRKKLEALGSNKELLSDFVYKNMLQEYAAMAGEKTRINAYGISTQRAAEILAMADKGISLQEAAIIFRSEMKFSNQGKGFVERVDSMIDNLFKASQLPPESKTEIEQLKPKEKMPESVRSFITHIYDKSGELIDPDQTLSYIGLSGVFNGNMDSILKELKRQAKRSDNIGQIAHGLLSVLGEGSSLPLSVKNSLVLFAKSAHIVSHQYIRVSDDGVRSIALNKNTELTEYVHGQFNNIVDKLYSYDGSVNEFLDGLEEMRKSRGYDLRDALMTAIRRDKFSEEYSTVLTHSMNQVAANFGKIQEELTGIGAEIDANMREVFDIDFAFEEKFSSILKNADPAFYNFMQNLAPVKNDYFLLDRSIRQRRQAGEEIPASDLKKLKVYEDKTILVDGKEIKVFDKSANGTISINEQVNDVYKNYTEKVSAMYNGMLANLLYGYSGKDSRGAVMDRIFFAKEERAKALSDLSNSTLSEKQKAAKRKEIQAEFEAAITEDLDIDALNDRGEKKAIGILEFFLIEKSSEETDAILDKEIYDARLKKIQRRLESYLYSSAVKDPRFFANSMTNEFSDPMGNRINAVQTETFSTFLVDQINNHVYYGEKNPSVMQKLRSPYYRNNGAFQFLLSYAKNNNLAVTEEAHMVNTTTDQKSEFGDYKFFDRVIADVFSFLESKHNYKQNIGTMNDRGYTYRLPAKKLKDFDAGFAEIKDSQQVFLNNVLLPEVNKRIAEAQSKEEASKIKDKFVADLKTFLSSQSFTVLSDENIVFNETKNAFTRVTLSAPSLDTVRRSLKNDASTIATAIKSTKKMDLFEKLITENGYNVEEDSNAVRKAITDILLNDHINRYQLKQLILGEPMQDVLGKGVADNIKRLGGSSSNYLNATPKDNQVYRILIKDIVNNGEKQTDGFSVFGRHLNENIKSTVGAFSNPGDNWKPLIYNIDSNGKRFYSKTSTIGLNKEADNLEDFGGAYLQDFIKKLEDSIEAKTGKRPQVLVEFVSAQKGFHENVRTVDNLKAYANNDPSADALFDNLRPSTIDNVGIQFNIHKEITDDMSAALSTQLMVQLFNNMPELQQEVMKQVSEFQDLIVDYLESGNVVSSDGSLRIPEYESTRSIANELINSDSVPEFAKQLLSVIAESYTIDSDIVKAKNALDNFLETYPDFNESYKDTLPVVYAKHDVLKTKYDSLVERSNQYAKNEKGEVIPIKALDHDKLVKMIQYKIAGEITRQFVRPRVPGTGLQQIPELSTEASLKAFTSEPGSDLVYSEVTVPEGYAEVGDIVVANRTPSSGYMTMVFGKVVANSPANMNTITVPTELMEYGDWDFDADKLFVYRRGLAESGEKNALFDKILDTIESRLQSREAIEGAKKKLTGALSVTYTESELGKHASKFSGDFDLSKSVGVRTLVDEARVANLIQTGNDFIGMFAIWNKMYGVLAQSGDALTKEISFGIDTDINSPTFGDLLVDGVSKLQDFSSERGEQMAQKLQAALDSPITITSMGVNAYTINVSGLLSSLGVDEQEVTLFLRRKEIVSASKAYDEYSSTASNEDKRFVSDVDFFADYDRKQKTTEVFVDDFETRKALLKIKTGESKTFTLSSKDSKELNEAMRYDKPVALKGLTGAFYIVTKSGSEYTFTRTLPQMSPIMSKFLELREVADDMFKNTVPILQLDQGVPAELSKVNQILGMYSPSDKRAITSNYLNRPLFQHYRKTLELFKSLNQKAFFTQKVISNPLYKRIEESVFKVDSLSAATQTKLIYEFAQRTRRLNLSKKQINDLALREVGEVLDLVKKRDTFALQKKRGFTIEELLRQIKINEDAKLDDDISEEEIISRNERIKHLAGVISGMQKVENSQDLLDMFEDNLFLKHLSLDEVDGQMVIRPAMSFGSLTVQEKEMVKNSFYKLDSFMQDLLYDYAVSRAGLTDVFGELSRMLPAKEHYNYMASLSTLDNAWITENSDALNNVILGEAVKNNLIETIDTKSRFVDSVERSEDVVYVDFVSENIAESKLDKYAMIDGELYEAVDVFEKSVTYEKSIWNDTMFEEQSYSDQRARKDAPENKLDLIGLSLKDGKWYSFNDINSQMLKDMGYTPLEIGKILKKVC